MSDDIVENLRLTADDTDAVENASVSHLLAEAAAEIESLRGYRDEAESQAAIASLAVERLTALVESLRREVREQRREIAALRDERKAVAEAERPAVAVEPPAAAIPPAWMARPFWVDPPQGHRHGFPKLYDRAFDGDMIEWMIRNGYPERLARQNLPCTFTAATDEELSKNDKP